MAQCTIEDKVSQTLVQIFEPIISNDFSNTGFEIKGDIDKKNYMKYIIQKLGKDMGLTQENPISPIYISGIKEALELYVDIPLLSDIKDINKYITDNLYLHTISKNITFETYNDSSIEIVSGEATNSHSDAFIADFFGGATRTQSDVRFEIGQLSIDTLLYNSKGTISTTRDINDNIREKQQDLLQKVLDYLKFRSPKKYDEVFGEKAPKMYIKDNSGNIIYTGIIETIQKTFGQELSKNSFSNQDLDTYTMYIHSDKVSKQEKDNARLKLNGYKSWIYLNNFENALQSVMGDHLVINPSYPQFTGENKYALGTKGTGKFESWSSDDDVDMSENTSNIVKLIINHIPYYDYKTQTPKLDSYINFNMYSHIVSKIKDLYFKKGIDPDFKVKIAKLCTDPQRTFKEIFEILSDTSKREQVLAQNSEYFSGPELNVIYSIYKGIFNDLYNVSDLNKLNYYHFITHSMNTIFSNKNVQYYKDEDGNVKLRTLYDSELGNIKINLETNINVNNSKDLISPKERFNKSDKPNDLGISEFDVTTYKGQPKGIKFKFLGATVEYTFANYKASIQKDVLDPNNKKTYIFNKEAAYEFIDKILKIDYANNTKFQNIFKSQYSYDAHNGDIDLLRLALTVYGNSYLASVRLRNKEGKVAQIGDLQAFLGENMEFKFNKKLQQIYLTTKTNTPEIKKLCTALSMYQGSDMSSVNKDGEGNAIGNTTSSRVLNNFPVQIETQCKRLDSATKHFSIFKLIKEIYNIRDFKDYASTKSIMEMNESEIFQSGFLYDFLAGLNNTEDLIADDVVAFIPSTNSDKNNVNKLLIELKELHPSIYNLIKSKNYEEAAIAVYNLASSELSDFAKQSKINIYEDLNKVLGIIGIEEQSDPITYIQENYQTLALSLNLSNPTPENVVFAITQKYNNNHRDKIEIIEHVHYETDKNGNIYINPLLQDSIDRSTSNSKYNNELQVLSDLIDFGTKLDITQFPEVTLEGWVGSNNLMVYGKVYDRNNLNVIYDITNLQDLQNICRIEDIKYTTPREVILKLAEKYKIQLNPMLSLYNSLKYLVGQEWLFITVGAQYAHGSKDTSGTILGDEASRYITQVKRNSSLTATMYPFQPGVNDGIPSECNVANIADPKDTQGIISGKIYDNIKYCDGATFVHPAMVYLENNSLGGQAAGTIKKPFIHAYDERTGTAKQIKTAGFGLTNFHFRHSEEWRTMMWNMSNRPWRDANDVILKNINIFDYGVTYHNVYFQNGSKKYYKIVNIKYEDNKYSRTLQQVDKFGNNIGDEFPEQYDEQGYSTIDPEMNNSVTTNYGIWKLFGGYRCMELKGSELEYSEKSIMAIVDSMNGVVIGGEQPLKLADIHYITTAGAVKMGAANTNSADYLNIRHTIDSNGYITNGLNMFKIKMNQAGIQLDKEHKASNETLALLTQVLSSCAQSNFTDTQSTELYRAITDIAKTATLEFQKSYAEILNGGDNHQFITVIANTIVESLARQETDSHIIAQNLIDKIRNGDKLEYSDVNIDFSGPDVFNKLISTINSTLTSLAIKIRVPGALSILHPSSGFIKIHDGKLLGKYSSKAELLEAQAKMPDIKEHLSKLDIGRTYRFTGDLIVPKDINHIVRDGYIEIPIQTHYDYIKVRKWLKTVKPDSIIEDIVIGRDLSNYNCRFKSGNTEYNIYDLDSVQNLIKLVQNKADKSAIDYARRQAQLDFATLSGMTGLTTVKVDNKPVIFETLEVQPYELIMSKVFIEQFGLKDSDNVSDIVNDPDFFLKRMAQNFRTKIESGYDVALLRLNGQHTYLLDGSQTIPEGFVENTSVMMGLKDGVPYRLVNGKPVHQIFKGDRILYKILGDGTKQEVILTDHIDKYIETSKYNLIKVSEECIDSDHIGTISEYLKQDQTYNRWLQAEQKRNKKRYKGASDIGKLRGYILNLNEISDAFTDPERLKEVSNKGIYKTLKHLSNQTRTSFLQHLNVLAARIPSQSMQSFMPMKIVAFTESDTNVAYVSTLQLLLQGSDFDIDTVSLMMYNISKNGMIEGWSKGFNYDSEELLNACLDYMPYPTNKKVGMSTTEVVDYDYFMTDDPEDDSTGQLRKLSKDINDPDFKKPFYITEDNKVYLRLDTLERIKMFSEYINLVNDINGIPYQIRNNPNILGTDIYNIENIVENLKDIVNEYNNYKFKSKAQQLRVLNNFIVHKQIQIIKPIINQMKAQSPIDDMTDRLNAIADTSIKAKGAAVSIPGAFTTDIKSFINNTTGNDGIGICAVGLKTLFGIRQAFTNIYRYGTEAEKDSLGFKVEIGDKSYTKLVNFNELSNQNLTRSILQNLNESDVQTSYDIEQWLLNNPNGIVTEGIKGPNTILSPFDKPKEFLDWIFTGKSLNNPDATPELREKIIQKILATPEHTPVLQRYDSGKPSISHAISYLINHKNLLDDRITNKGVVNAIMNIKTQEDAALVLSGLLSLATDNAKMLSLDKLNADTNMLGMYLYGIMIGMDFTDISNILMSTTGFKVSKMLKDNAFNSDYTYNMNDVLDYFSGIMPKSMLSKYKTTDYGGIEIAMPTNTLRHILSETYYLSLKQRPSSKQELSIEDALKLNLPKTKDELNALLTTLREARAKYNKNPLFQQFVDQVSEFYTDYYNAKSIIRSIDTLYNGAEELRSLGKIFSANQGIDNSVTDAIQFITDIEEIISNRLNNYNRSNARWTTNATKIQSDTYKFNLDSFINDSKYQAQNIDIYEKYKVSFNILRILTKANNFYEYVKTANLAHQAGMQSSAKYNAVYTYGSQATTALKAYKSKDKLKILKKVQQFVDDYISNAWMLTKNIQIKLPEGQKYIVGKDLKIKSANKNTVIRLGTKDGNASFKLLMESTIIPNLQRGFNGDTTNNTIYENKFIKSLHYIINDKTYNYAPQISMASVNTMPKSESETDMFDIIKSEFNSLTDLGINYIIEGQKFQVSDLFYLYNLISFGGRVGQQTLTKIFQDRNMKGFSGEHKQYISEFDKHSQILLDNNGFSKFLQYVAIKAFPYNTTMSMFYNQDSKTGIVNRYSISDQDNSNSYYDATQVGNEKTNNYIGIEETRSDVYLDNDVTITYYNGILKNISGLKGVTKENGYLRYKDKSMAISEINPAPTKSVYRKGRWIKVIDKQLLQSKIDNLTQQC